MEIKIKNKNVDLNFNKIGFIRALDEEYKAERGGVKFGFGLMFAQLYLEQYSVPALAVIIKCALFDQKYTLRDVDTAIEKYAEEHGDLDGLFEGVVNELGKAPLVKTTVKKLKEMEKNQKTGLELA